MAKSGYVTRGKGNMRSPGVAASASPFPCVACRVSESPCLLPRLAMRHTTTPTTAAAADQGLKADVAGPRADPHWDVWLPSSLEGSRTRIWYMTVYQHTPPLTPNNTDVNDCIDCAGLHAAFGVLCRCLGALTCLQGVMSLVGVRLGNRVGAAAD